MAAARRTNDLTASLTRHRHRHRHRHAYARDTFNQLRRQPADVVVSLDLLFGPLIGAKAAGVPAVSLATQFSMFVPIPGVPPAGPGLLPPTTDEARAEAANDDRRLVLVAMSSTFQNQGPTIQAVLDAAATLPVRVLVTRGPGFDGAGLRVPENAAVVASAPHDQVRAQTAVVVTHCGHGTIMRALANGCPLLCLPMGRDQNDNAARVAARGAGLRLTRDAAVDDLRAALVRLLDDPAFAQSATALGRAIAEAEPRNALVEALEQVAASHR